MVELPARIVEQFAQAGERGTGKIPWDYHWEIIFACREALETENYRADQAQSNKDSA